MSIKRLAFEEEVVPIRITTTFFSIFLMSFILADVQSIELKSRLLFYSERTGDKTEYWVRVIIEQPLGEYFFKEGLTLLTHLTNSTCYFSLWREANLL